MASRGLFLFLLACLGSGLHGLQPEVCEPASRELLINPDAHAFIGVVLSLRGPGPGLMGCGPPTRDGVELLEGLRWAVDVLNNAATNASSDAQHLQSFVPGVKLGVRVWDTCGHPSAVPQALSALLPVLQEGPALCSQHFSPSNSSALMVGLVDGVGFSRDPAIRLTLGQFNVPVLVLEPETLVAAEDRAKAVVALALELQWRQVALVHGTDDYGTRMYRAAIRLAADSDLCVVAAERLEVADEREASATLAAVRTASTAAASTPRGSNVTGVLVMARRSNFLPLLETIRHVDTAGLQWLFSDLLTTQDSTADLSDRFYSLALAPPSIPLFEQHWSMRAQQSGRSVDNNLIQEYEMTRRRCRLPGWAGPNISELPPCSGPPKRDSPDSLRAALRGRNAAAALHVVHTLSHALRAAWSESCRAQGPGICPELRKLTRQQFQSKFLSPLEFDHAAPGSRVSGAPRGGKVRAGDPSEMAASSLALLSYRGDRSSDSQKLHKLFEFHLDGVEVSDRSFRSSLNRVDLPCLEGDQEGQCPRCLRLREGRVRGATATRSTLPSNSRLPPHHIIASPQHVYVAAVFSVQSPPPSGAPLLGECGPVEVSSARQVEAFTWALRRVNERTLAPLGIKLGAVVLDACHSAARALTLPASLMGEGSEPILAAVNALPDKEEASAASGVFHALNITSLATSSERSLADKYNLQLGPAATSMTSALKDVLSHLGWDYVSVLTSEGDLAAENGLKTLRSGSVCIALEESVPAEGSLDQLVARVLGARAGGARAVVLWTRPEDTRRVLVAVANAQTTGSLRGEDVFWLVVSPHGEAINILEEFGDVIGGALVFRPEKKPVRDFLQYLRRLRQDEIHKNMDNPWLETYYEQVLQVCAGAECERSQQLLLEEGVPEDARTIQAVYALGAAVARARRELCPEVPAGLPGLCPPGGGRPEMKQALNAFLHYTPSERAGGGEDFTFTTYGAGHVAIEILNMRRGGARGRALQAGSVHFEQVGVYRGEMQSLAGLLGYRDSGEEVPLASLASRCLRRCSRCRSADRFVITHPGTPALQLGVSLAMHNPSATNPLECEAEVRSSAVEQLEALLWSLDRANLNFSTRLSAVVMDTCGSAARASRDVALLLDDLEEEISGRLIAMVAADGPAVAGRVTDLANPLSLPVLTSESSLYKPNSPFPLQLSAGLKLRAQGLVGVARSMEWSAVSALYMEGVDNSEAMLKLLQAEARRQGLLVVETVVVPSEEEAFTDVLLRLRDQTRESGVRSVVLLLPPRQMEFLFRASRSLQEEGEIIPGEIIWMTAEAEKIFDLYSDQTPGSLALRPLVGRVPDFEQHFRRLNISQSARNPWFSEFWGSVFHCRGAACDSGLYKDLATYAMDKSPEVVNVINSVMTISHALESVRRELCPEPGPADCIAMEDLDRVRQRLFEMAPRMVFVGAGMSGVAFSSRGENARAALEVLNVRLVGSGVFGLAPVGSVTPSGDLEMDPSSAKAYTADLSEMSLRDIRSDCESCESNILKHTYVEILPSSSVTLLAVGSVHSSADNSLSLCGDLRSPAAFQRAAALSFAVEHFGKNSSRLGSLLFDDCSQPSRAIYHVFGYLGNNNASSVVASPDTVTAALLLDSDNQGLEAMLSSQGIPSFLPEDKTSNVRARLHAALGLARDLGWSRLTVVRKEGCKWGEMASEMLKREILPTMRGSCLGDDVSLELANEIWNKELHAEAGTPLLLLFKSHEDTRQVLSALSEMRQKSRVVVVSGWDNTEVINDTMDVEIFTLSTDLSDNVVPGFREYVAASVASGSGSIPSEWSSEFLDMATGIKWQQAEGVAEIVRTVRWITEEIKRLCRFEENSEDVPLCGLDPQSFRREVAATMAAKMSSTAPSLAVWRLNEIKGYDKVGTWKQEHGLKVTVDKWRRPSGHDCESLRAGRSGKLTLVLEEVPPPPAMLGELKQAWGVACAAISVLGALLTVALVVYFASATEKATGTSVLGYQILFGVLLLYASNLSFLVAPSELSCAARRLLPGLAYALVLSGMLVKVVTTWRCQGCQKSGSLPDGDPLSRPGALLCCSLALLVVQVFLAGGWLILLPPSIEAPITSSGSWECAAASGRELLGSLSFLGALLLLTAAVAIKARKDGEARNILACCVLLGVAGGAWVAAANSTSLLPLHRDCVAGVVAGLVAAKLVLLCLFLPKLLQHARMGREVSRDQRRHQHQVAAHQSKLQPVQVYGLPHNSMPHSVSHYNSASHSAHSLVIKAFPEPDELLGVERLMGVGLGEMIMVDGSVGVAEDTSEAELADICGASEDEDDIVGDMEISMHQQMRVEAAVTRHRDPTQEVPSALYPLTMFSAPPTCSFIPQAPPLPSLSLVDHRMPGSNEFTVPPPLPDGALSGEELARHEGISYI